GSNPDHPGLLIKIRSLVKTFNRKAIADSERLSFLQIGTQAGQSFLCSDPQAIAVIEKQVVNEVRRNSLLFPEKEHFFRGNLITDQSPAIKTNPDISFFIRSDTQNDTLMLKF